MMVHVRHCGDNYDDGGNIGINNTGDGDVNQDDNKHDNYIDDVIDYADTVTLAVASYMR